jgi:hexosaminidase
VIMATDPVMYFDHRQTDLPDEPPGRGVVVSLKDIYAFEPAPPALAAAEAGHIIGLQANVWTEHIRTEARLEAMTFPRAAAVAEVGWSDPSRRDWTGFAARLTTQFGRYRALGVAADEGALAVKLEVADDPAAAGRLQVALSTQLGQGQIRYTTDGSEPGPGSDAYAAPVSLALPLRLRAAAFDGDRRLGAETEADLGPETIRRRTSQALRTCTGKLVLNLEGAGPRGGGTGPYLVDIMNPCWVYPAGDLTGAAELSVGVTRLAWNFQLGADLAKIPVRPPQTAAGELEVRLDTCAGELVASLPLAPATLQGGVTPLSVRLPPRAGRHDLCIAVNARGVDPIWALAWVQLSAGPPPAALAAR